MKRLAVHTRVDGDPRWGWSTPRRSLFVVVGRWCIHLRVQLGGRL